MATVVKSKAELLERSRSPWVSALLATLDRKSWVGRDELYNETADSVPVNQALNVYDKRIHYGPGGKVESRKVQIQKGRAMQLMLALITLVQHGKVVQRGRGPTKEYKLA